MKKITRKDIKILGEGPQVKKAILERYADIETFYAKSNMSIQFNTFKSYLSRDKIESDNFRCAITIALNISYYEVVLTLEGQLKALVNSIYDNIRLYNDVEDEYTIKKLRKLCKKEGMQLEVAMLYRAMARNYHYTNKITRAIECYEIAIEELPKGEIDMQVFYWCEQAYVFYCEYMREKAEKRFKYVDELVQIHKSKLSNNTMYYYYYWRGITYLYGARYRTSREHFEKAADYATKNFEKAGANCNIGLSYKKINKFKDALHYYNEALTYPDEVNLSPAVVTYNNLGELYRKMKDYENAQKYVDLAIETNEKQYDLSNHLTCIQTAAEIQMDLGNESSYKEYFDALLNTKGKYINKYTLIFRLKSFITNSAYNLPCLKDLTRVILDLTKASNSEDYISGLRECLGLIYEKLLEYGGIRYEKNY